MRYEMNEIFIKHAYGLRKSQFALVRMLDDNGNEIGTGMCANDEGIYRQPMKEEIDTTQVSTYAKFHTLQRNADPILQSYKPLYIDEENEPMFDFDVNKEYNNDSFQIPTYSIFTTLYSAVVDELHRSKKPYDNIPEILKHFSYILSSLSRAFGL